MNEESKTEPSKTLTPFDVSKAMAAFDLAKMMDAFTKALQEYQFPEVDIDVVLESNRKNVDALATANKVLLEGAQGVLKRQEEILRETMEETAAAMKDLSDTIGSPTDIAATRTDSLKYAFEKALTHMRELSEITAKANVEALEPIQARISESLDEIKALLLKREK